LDNDFFHFRILKVMYLIVYMMPHYLNVLKYRVNIDFMYTIKYITLNPDQYFLFHVSHVFTHTSPNCIE
jgi:hypothetical protein